MNNPLPTIYLARHGETAWSRTGQHTGTSDLPLTEHGEFEARQLHDRLAGIAVDRIFRSTSLRAKTTCALAGFGDTAADNPDLVEWNYGEYEGLTSAEIHAKRPDWFIYRDGCPGGESPGQIQARADRVVQQLRAINGNVLIFSSGHFLRVLTARWLGLEIYYGRFLALDTASVSELGYEHGLSQPVIRFWNDTRHLANGAAVQSENIALTRSSCLPKS